MRSWRRLAFESGPAVPHRQSRISAKRSASQVARTTGPMRGQRFICVGVKLARAGITLDRRVKLLRIERLEPGAKSRQLVWRKLLDGLFNIFGGGHRGNIAIVERLEKSATGREFKPGCLREIGFAPTGVPRNDKS